MPYPDYDQYQIAFFLLLQYADTVHTQVIIFQTQQLSPALFLWQGQALGNNNNIKKKEKMHHFVRVNMYRIVSDFYWEYFTGSVSFPFGNSWVSDLIFPDILPVRLLASQNESEIIQY